MAKEVLHTKGTTLRSVPRSDLVWVQAIECKGQVLACAHCATLLGTHRSQLAVACQTVDSIAEALAATAEDGSWSQCLGGCGEVYCTAACRDAAGEAGHRLLCVGPLSDSHPLCRFKMVALHSGMYDDLMLAVGLLVRGPAGDAWVLCQGCTPWWEEPPAGVEEEEAAGWAEEAQGLCVDCWNLLCEALPAQVTAGHTAADWGRLINWTSSFKIALETPSPMERRLAFSSLHEEDFLADGDMRNQLVDFGRQVLLEEEAEAGEEEEQESEEEEATEARQAEEAEEAEEVEEAEERNKEESLQAAINVDKTNQGGEPCEEDAKEAPALPGLGNCDHTQRSSGGDVADETGDRNHLGDAKEAAGSTSIAGLSDNAVLGRMIADPSMFFPQLQVVVAAPAAVSYPHSCAPTAEWRMGAGMGVDLVALSDITAEEPLTVSRIDATAGLETRTEDLEMIGVHGCKCIRCVVEGALEDSRDDAAAARLGGVATVEQLRALSELAEQHERYEDQLGLLEEILARLPGDGDALYTKAMVRSWTGEYSESRRQMRDALQTVPTHPRLTSRLRQYDSYFSGQCPPLREDVDFAGVEGLDDRAFVCPALLSASSCASLVEDVERHLGQRGGWTTTRHYSVPTTDVPIHTVPRILAWFNAALESDVFPLLARQFRCDAACIRVIDAFVVKYDASKQRALPLHQDESQFSITLALNDPAEYAGGGTYFTDVGRPINCGTGGLISFSGDLFHGGFPISNGTRYIAVAFLYAHGDG